MASKKRSTKRKTKAVAGEGESAESVEGSDETPPPHPFVNRPYQSDVDVAWDEGKRRFILIWHRRAGKDRKGMEFIRDRSKERIANYWHMFPFHVQARRAIWGGIDPNSGVRFIDQAFPPHERDGKPSELEMKIQLAWGSTYQMLGSDKFNNVIGAPPAGVVFSEWALCNPAAWTYIRPILAENDGWAMFITTYRGMNHAYQMVKRLRDNDRWYVDIRTVEDTTREDGSPVITPEAIEAERREGMSDRMVRQEFYCDPMAGLAGSIYGASMNEMFDQRRAG